MQKNNTNSTSEIAIQVKDIGKYYRIGVKEKSHDNLGGALLDFIKSPLRNYKKYRSLYRFDDIESNDKSNVFIESHDILHALKNISFEVNRGEVLGIIGKNGAGKSTLLKILSRITVPTSGYAKIYGKVSSLLEVGTGFHPELTGRENIYLNGTVLGMTKHEVDRKFDEIVEFSGVEKFIDTPVKRYSSGMTVRLAFSVAAHMEPEILIIDEVLAVGDAAFQKKCLSKMQDVRKKGRTILFVSHNMSAVTRLCDRTILLESGSIIKDGPSHEVVGSYLRSSEITPAERLWDDPSNAPGSDVVRLCALKIRNEEGQIAAAVEINKPVYIEIEYEVLKPGFSLLPHFMLNNQNGVLVFIGLDQDPNWRGKARPMGTYISTAKIPGNLLSEGTLFVGPIMRTVEPDLVHFAQENLVGFEVIDSADGNSARGEWTRDIRGIIRPLLDWNTIFNPKTNKNRKYNE